MICSINGSFVIMVIWYHTILQLTVVRPARIYEVLLIRASKRNKYINNKH